MRRRISWAILSLFVFGIPSRSYSAIPSHPWKTIESSFVLSKPLERIYKRFYLALHSPKYPVIIMAGAGDSDKAYLLHQFRELFQPWIRFDATFDSLLDANGGFISAQKLNEILNTETRIWEKNRVNGKATVVLLSTDPARKSSHGRSQIALDHVTRLYKNMLKFNAKFPATPVRLILDSKISVKQLEQSLQQRKVGHYVIEFTQSCDALLGSPSAELGYH
jgi:hypothetical protein